MKPTHIVETCTVKEVETALDLVAADYDLVAMSSHQVGSGYGSFVQVVLVFRLRAPAENGNGNGNHRRKPMPAVPVK